MEDKEFGKLLEELLKSINYKLSGIMRNAYSPLGVTKSQGFILMLVSQHNNQMLVSEICAVLQTPPSNITNICNRLELNGFINKLRDDSDRRKVSVMLTDKGEKLIKTIKENHENYIKRIMASATKSDRDAIIDGLQRLNNNINININI